MLLRPRGGTSFALSRDVRPLVAGTIVVILLLAGATRLPPSFLPGVTDSVKTKCGTLFADRRGENERLAGMVLKTLASAEADFRANDRDGDGRQHFWRGDVAGLRFLSPPGGMPIGLIELDAAAADDRPLPNYLGKVPQRAFHGYRFRAIRHPDETPNRLDPHRFAFVAYPVNQYCGRRMLIIDENNSIRSCCVEQFDGIDVFPTDAELRADWWRWG